jgi:hypothetical protein
MKKSLFKSVLATCLLVVAMLFGAQNLSAQSGTLTGSAGSGQSPIKVTGTWVSSNDAITILTVKIQQIESILVGMGLPIGNATTDQMKTKSAFYENTVSSLVTGKDVPTSILAGYNHILGNYATAVDNNPSAAAAEASLFKSWFDETVDLLNN